MKKFLKENWFRLGIIFIIISSLIVIFYFNTQKQKEFRVCVKNAQEEKGRRDKEVTTAWLEGMISPEWAEQNYKEIKDLYDDNIKDCLLLK